MLTDICDPGWSYFGGFCYFTSDSCSNWTTALAKCRSQNSVLVDVGNNEENVYIQHRHNGEKSWLGLNDISTEGNFSWADRGNGNFTAWAKNQPNNFGDEDCVHTLGVKFNYEWNDVKCSNCYPYTCKKGKIVFNFALFPRCDDFNEVFRANEQGSSCLMRVSFMGPSNFAPERCWNLFFSLHLASHF